jgi:hypothetical protein
MAGRAKPALRVHAALMASVANINDVLEGHVALEVECADQLQSVSQGMAYATEVKRRLKPRIALLRTSYP